MKRFVLLAVAAVGLLTGCAHRYVVTLSNGTQLTAIGRPRLVDGNYVFKDASKRPVYVPSGRVREIAPASMANKENDLFTPATLK